MNMHEHAEHAEPIKGLVGLRCGNDSINNALINLFSLVSNVRSTP